MSNLLKLWPTAENCNECLTAEAESDSDAVFLAVHQPMQLSKRQFDASEEQAQSVSEDDLLEAFLSNNLDSGTLLMPIVGAAGVGKSHMIRWLGAQLGAIDDGVRRHVVRIPKSSSLRTVLSLILDDLKGESDAYQQLHNQLSSASMPQELDDATMQLLGKIGVALQRNAEDVMARFNTSEAREDDEQRVAHCHQMPLLLREPSLVEHFIAHKDPEQLGVLARIASRYINGDASAEGPKNVFSVEDFSFDESFRLQDASRPVQQYLNMLSQGSKYISGAVACLNEVVDQSLRELIDFGSVSLTDLFVEIREQMLEDEIELVLLVEDFASLAGIQGSLLDAIIREGVRDGDKVLCTMRTALAVTRGYGNLLERDTVKQRAKYFWRISDNPFANETDAVQTYTKFVGGYLNAARWGKESIERRYPKLGSTDERESWLPDYYSEIREDLTEEENDVIRSFGSTESGVALFPFNHGVIRQLVRKYFVSGEHDEVFKFNPRSLINKVLRDTLVNFRDSFKQTRFPPPNFQGFDRNTADLSVNNEIGRRFPNRDTRGRVEAFAYFWGNAPRAFEEVEGIHPLVFQAFGLEHPTGVVPQLPEGTKRVTVEVDPNPNLKPQPQTDPLLDAEIAKIDNWRSGQSLSQKEANFIRSLLASDIEECVDWNSLFIDKIKIDKTRLFLPGVNVGIQDETKAIACAGRLADLENDEVRDRFFASMYALVRYNHHKSWDYSEGERDFGAYATLIRAMTTEVESYFSEVEAHGLPRSAISIVAKSLLIGGRILGVDGASSNLTADNIASIYRNYSGEITDDGEAWGRVCKSSAENRSDLIKLLSKFTVAQQGTRGDKVLAYDASYLIELVKENRGSWALPDDVQLNCFKDMGTIQEYLKKLKGTLANSVEQKGEKLQKWREDVCERLGEDFDPQQLQKEFLELLTQARQQQVFVCRDVDYDQMRKLVRSLLECGIKENMKLIHNLSNSEDFGQRLSSLSKVDEAKVQRATSILSAFEKFVMQTGQRVDERLETAPPGIDAVANRCRSHIAAIDGYISEMEGGDT